MRRTLLRAISLPLVLVLFGAACGSDRDDDAAPGTTDAPEDTGGDDVTFGDLESPCGEGEGGPAGDQGVTEDTITIGYGDDAGFPGAPGLNHHQSDAMRAMIEWCNEQGGINGREIVGNYYDAKVTEVVNVTTRACDEVFMMVGHGFALDAANEETRVACELPSVPGWTVGLAAAHGPLMHQPVPNPVDMVSTYGAEVLADLFPDEVKKSAVFSSNHSSGFESRAKFLSAYPKHGWKFMDCGNLEYNITGESDWKPFANKLKECGAEVVLFIGVPFPTLENFLEAADQLDYHPIFLGEANYYDDQFRKWSANGLANKVHIRLMHLPFEDRDEVAAVDDYLSLLEGSGGDPAILGMQAASAFLLWASAADACGADVSRACVLEEISKVEDWTGGGLHAPTSPAENRPPECGMVLKVTDGDFVRVQPEKSGTLDCDRSYVAEVEREFVEQAKLDENRVSTLFEK